MNPPTYTQLGSGTQFSLSQIQAPGFNPSAKFIESGTGRQVTASDLFAPTPAPANTSQTTTTAPPPTTNIGNPVAPPTTSGTPAPVTATAPTLLDQSHTTLSTTLANQQSSLQSSYDTQIASYTQQKDALTQQNTELQSLQDNGMLAEGSTVQQETAAKQAALDQYQAEYKTNFDARQKLTDTLSTLLTTGQSIIENLKNTSGLSSIMNARISQTMAEVQGQAGVISASLAAYDTQIGLATTHLTTAVSAITSIYTDQIAYWKNVVDFYKGQETANDTKITALTADAKSYIDAQIKTHQDAITNTQATAKIIQDAMLDPTKALTYAKAGVSLTDTPAQISQKLAAQAQADQNVWGAPELKGGDYIQTNKLTGETRTVVANVVNPSSPNTPTNPAYAKGTMASKQYVELSLQRAGLKYADALAKVPAGKVGVIDNKTGQIGSINPTDYNTKQYTYL